LGSSATAILKTNYEYYESTIGAHYHDGDVRELNSKGGLFYGIGEDNNYRHAASFTKKYKDGQSNESYTHDSYTNIISYGGSLQFTLAQGKVDTANQLGSSFGYETFDWDWSFEVLNDNTFLNFVLNPIGSSGSSLLKLTNITTNTDVSFDAGAEASVSLEEGNNYLLSLSLYNWASWDGLENYNSLYLSNAIFPVPAPNNILILLLALIALAPLRKSLK